MEPEFWRLVNPYLDHGNREYLTRILQLWSPSIDRDNSIGHALHHAIFIGDETAVRMILDAGASPTMREAQDPNYTPLLAASQRGRREMARLFWKLVGPDGRFYPSRTPELTCLQVAARNGHADLVADFLDMWDGWSADETRRALRDAASSWRDDVVALLLAKVPYEAGAIQDALEAGVEDKAVLFEDPTKSPLGGTAENELRQQHLVCQLIDAGGNPNGNLHNRPLVPKTVLSVERIGALRGLLEKGANPNIQDPNGKTALHKLFGRVSSSTTTLRVLLQHGASPEIADQAGETPLHAAAYTGTLEQLQLCLASCQDADAAIRLRTSHEESLLHYAAAGGRQDIAEFLLSRGLSVDLANDNGWTALMCALMPTKIKWVSAGCSLANLLLEQGASAQVVSDEGWTPLHALASYPTTHSATEPERWEGVVPLALELISRGTPLDTESRVVRSLSVTTERLCDAWGFRMQRLAENVAPWSAETPGGVPDADTTPLMWAYRAGAMGIFNAITAHWASVNNAGS
jgi:ankyrin repeat protein